MPEPKACGPECDFTHGRALGMCKKHYQRWHKHGSTELMSPEERFWSHTHAEGECILWDGYLRPDGRGELGVPGERRTILAHRYAWLITHGSLPDLPLDHVKARGCMGPRCVNPSHLEPVTPLENNRRERGLHDRSSGRTTCPRGHDLTDPAVAYVRTDRRSGVACRLCGRIHARNYNERRKARGN